MSSLTLKALSALLIILLSGCTGTPFVKMGMGHRMGMSDPATRSDAAGDNPLCIYGGGYRWDMHDSRTRIEYDHKSKCFDGGPFNHRDEYYTDDIQIIYEQDL